MVFNLFDGFKLIINNEEIENLKFDNYKIEFPNIAKKEFNHYDKNTLGIYELFYIEDENNKIIITQRLFDILIIISFIFYFYIYIIKSNNYTLKNLLLFIILSIVVLTTDNLIENFEFNDNTIFSINAINVLMIHLIGIFLKLIKFYE